MSNYVRPNISSSTGYIPGEQPSDTTTIKLNTNENPYPPSPRVLAAIHAIAPEQLRRYPNPNARPFREAAAKVHGVSADMIQTFNGGDELLACAIRATAGESDKVAFLEPSYSLYPVLTAVQGATALPIPYDLTEPSAPTQMANGKWQMANALWSLPPNIESTAAAIMFIVNPNAPTGHFNPINRLIEIARAFRGLLLIDEAYIDFAQQSALALVRDLQLPNVILLRTLSKGYALAGLRFGYALAQPALLAQLEKVRDSYPCDAVAIAAATAAIEDQPYARSTWARVISERIRLTESLRALGFSVSDSQSNFLLAQAPNQSKLPAERIYLALKDRGILVRWWDLPRIADKLRITVGTPEQNDKLVAELARLI